jgi:hypothetical protein
MDYCVVHLVDKGAVVIDVKLIKMPRLAQKKKRVKKLPPPLIRPDGKHIKKRKKHEDPRKPKKALPPYLLFVQV